MQHDLSAPIRLQKNNTVYITYSLSHQISFAYLAFIAQDTWHSKKFCANVTKQFDLDIVWADSNVWCHICTSHNIISSLPDPLSEY